MRISFHIVLVVSFIFFTSCKNERKSDSVDSEAALNSDSSVVTDTLTQKYPVWISEFQKLSQALYNNDTNTITTFFDFPLNKEKSDGLLAAIYFNTNKEIGKDVRLTNKSIFIKYCNQIFPSLFVKGLVSVKNDSLQINNFAKSADWKLPNDNATYHASVSYDDYEKTVSLLLNAVYGNDGSDSEEDETESATVYIFKLDKNNKLKFDRVEMAG